MQGKRAGHLTVTDGATCGIRKPFSSQADE
jgi:hypothetical protein